MGPIKFSLCPDCAACPEVRITDEGVMIDERANAVRLSHADCNELVALMAKDGSILVCVAQVLLIELSSRHRQMVHLVMRTACQ